jgi:23S rRNA pseudouridine1911/1915/1917 synthase
MASRFGISGDVVEGSRLDLVLTRQPFALSRREAKRRLASGDVVVDGRPVSVASRAVSPGAHVSLLSADAAIVILKLDASVAVVDKPDALPTQPSPGSSNPSLLEVLASQLKKRDEKPDLFIVHRLDTNTTGVVALARSKRAADELSREITSEAEKLYLAICEGEIDSSVTIDAPIARLSGNQFGVDSKGRPSKTHLRPLGNAEGVSLLEVTIETGRTHQIRVHLSEAGFPVVGDTDYGRTRRPPKGGEQAFETLNQLNRTALHAARLAFHHPRSREISQFEAPLPSDIQQVLDGLRQLALV